MDSGWPTWEKTMESNRADWWCSYTAEVVVSGDDIILSTPTETLKRFNNMTAPHNQHCNSDDNAELK